MRIHVLPTTWIASGARHDSTRSRQGTALIGLYSLVKSNVSSIITHENELNVDHEQQQHASNKMKLPPTWQDFSNSGGRAQSRLSIATGCSLIIVIVSSVLLMTVSPYNCNSLDSHTSSSFAGHRQRQASGHHPTVRANSVRSRRNMAPGAHSSNLKNKHMRQGNNQLDGDSLNSKPTKRFKSSFGPNNNNNNANQLALNQLIHKSKYHNQQPYLNDDLNGQNSNESFGVANSTSGARSQPHTATQTISGITIETKPVPINHGTNDPNNNNDTVVNLNSQDTRQQTFAYLSGDKQTWTTKNVNSINGTIDLSQYEQSDVDRLYGDALLVYLKNFNE